jgi:hypothetical protein
VGYEMYAPEEGPEDKEDVVCTTLDTALEGDSNPRK